MYYTDQFVRLFAQINHFISDNQIFLTAALLAVAYFLKRFIDHKAAQPQKDIWDDLKPASDGLYAIAHKGVELLGKAKGLDKAQKLLEYLKVIEAFEKRWQTDKLAAVRELAAWYLSMEAKQIAPNPSTEPLTADSVAVEESSRT